MRDSKDGLKILFVAAEDSNLIKVGGLGDVAGELPWQLSRLGADVRVFLPCYQAISDEKRYITDFPVPMGFRTETCIVREVIGTRLKTYLFDQYHYFGRPCVYGYQDDPERFAFFCLSVFEYLKQTDFIPDIIHLNDWHTAPLAMLVKERGSECPQLSETAVIYTIHSLEYQGICGRDIFFLYGVKESLFNMEQVEYFGCFNPMKAGICYADRINTVSGSFAQEMMTKRLGFGLEGLVTLNKDRLSGIINGLDPDIWNPQTDSDISQNYSIESIALKRENKLKLQDELGLKHRRGPLYGAVLRLVANKGVGLLIESIETIVKAGGQLVVLGKGDRDWEQRLADLAMQYPGNVSFKQEFNSSLARRIYAGCDLYLMPSWYEPCGLSQQIAMRYGTVPIVYHTGGLADTVVDESTHQGQGTGFAFYDYSLKGFLEVIKKAFRHYSRNKNSWEDLMKRAMARDASWGPSAEAYMKLYQEAWNKKHPPRKKRGKAASEKKG